MRLRTLLASSAAALLVAAPAAEARAGKLRIRAHAPSVAAGFGGNCANASAGTPQFPTLLDTNPATNLNGKTFAAVPTFQVMGVSCKAGYPDGQVFKVPCVDTLPAGITAACTGSTFNNRMDADLRVAGVDGLLDGWDLSGAYILMDIGSQSLRITKSKWTPYAGSPQLLADNGKSTNTGLVRVDHSELNGNGISGAIVIRGVTPTIQFEADNNYVHDGDSDGFQVTTSFTDFKITNNLFVNMGASASSHADMAQIFPSAANLTMTGGAFSGNTMYQGPANGTTGLPSYFNSAVRAGDFATTTVLSGFLFQNNVAVGIGSTGHAGAGGNIFPALGTLLQGFGAEGNTSTTTGLQADNNWVYTDTGAAWDTGTHQGFYNGPWQQQPGSSLSASTITNNTQMRDGSALLTVSKP